MKKFLCIIVAAFMLVVSSSAVLASAPESAEPAAQSPYTSGSKISSNDYTVVAENENLSLAVNGVDGLFTLTNKKTGKVWSSNPILTEEEEEQVKLGLSKIKSQLCITYLTAERTDGSVNGSTAKITVNECLVDGKRVGFITTYNFNKKVVQMEIPVAYTLTENGLKAEILYEQIKELGTSQLSSIELLPMFGAAKPTDTGYLFLPDGSGALVDFATMKDGFPDFSEMVYGNDSSVSLNLRMLPFSEGVKMPVFGSKVGNDAYIGIITSGDAVAKINATCSATSYNVASAWTTFYYREFDEVGIISKDSMSRSVRLLDPNIATENPVVEYNILSGEDANYSGMAKVYRDYLVNRYSLKKVTAGKVAPVLQTFGKSYSSETFFGIPIKKGLAATTLSDAEGFYKYLKENGVDTAKFMLYGFQKGGYQNKYVSKFSVDRKVGGKKGLKSFVETVGSGNVYMAYDLIHDYNYGGIFADSKYVAALNKVTITKQNGIISTGAYKGTLSWKLISNKTLNKFAEKLVRSYDEKLGVGLIFEGTSTELYNDFDEKYHADRNEYVTTYEKIASSAADKGVSVGADGANIYSIMNADIITEVPISSSNKLLFTDSVPFYAMVVHGYANISSTALNGSADMTDAVAACAQYGIMPTYRVTALDSYELRNSNFSFLFNSGFDSVKKDIVEDYKLINSVSDGLSDQIIVSHEYVGELSVTDYENGVKIVYNRSKTETVNFGGKEIAPREIVRF